MDGGLLAATLTTFATLTESANACPVVGSFLAGLQFEDSQYG